MILRIKAYKISKIPLALLGAPTKKSVALKRLMTLVFSMHVIMINFLLLNQQILASFQENQPKGPEILVPSNTQGAFISTFKISTYYTQGS
jgi:hypothetical protein